MNMRDIYQEVTDKIVAALEAGTVPWKKPWRVSGGTPVSLSTGKPYRGINVLLLGLAGFSDCRWGTFKAIREAAVAEARHQGREIVMAPSKRGDREEAYEVVDGERVWFHGGVRKGEKATSIILWKPVKKGEGDTEERYMLLRSYSVFNSKQADGLPELPVAEERIFTPIQEAENLVEGYVSDISNDNPGPPVRYGYDAASYSLIGDVVSLPDPKQFDGDEEYYCTLFHELIHSTGHKKRLARIEPALFGSDPYAKEELVAEIGASFLAGVAGFEDAGGEQSAAYIANWMQRIKDTPRLVVQAAAQAQKAADLILGTTFDEPSLQGGDRQEVAA